MAGVRSKLKPNRDNLWLIGLLINLNPPLLFFLLLFDLGLPPPASCCGFPEAPGAGAAASFPSSPALTGKPPDSCQIPRSKATGGRALTAGLGNTWDLSTAAFTPVYTSIISNWIIPQHRNSKKQKKQNKLLYNQSKKSDLEKKTFKIHHILPIWFFKTCN